jgi:hypothetical protein
MLLIFLPELFKQDLLLGLYLNPDGSDTDKRATNANSSPIAIAVLTNATRSPVYIGFRTSRLIQNFTLLILFLPHINAKNG